ncbi:hypothetical protein PHLGIDRAFT_80589, partial [Phlebiopsis gigantea 11061_1 CR5-6]
LSTIFYLSYLVFEYPQNLALQHFPVGEWMRCVARLLACHACTDTCLASTSSSGALRSAATPLVSILSDDCLSSAHPRDERHGSVGFPLSALAASTDLFSHSPDYLGLH